MGQDVFNSISMDEDTAKNKEFFMEHRVQMIHFKKIYAGYSAHWMFRHPEFTLLETIEA
jgi:hypothetical protein